MEITGCCRFAVLSAIAVYRTKYVTLHVDCIGTPALVPETEFSVWLHFPGRFGLQYPLFDYPRIAELRAILEGLDVSDTLIFWEGRYFLASTGFDEEEKVSVEFRPRDSGIRLVFRHDDWEAIKSLFRRGWQAPEVVRLWNALAREYGEL